MSNLNHDFNRDVWCLLGLPFDNCHIKEAGRFIEQSVRDNENFVLSTPNVNFVALAAKDKEFRDAIYQSDYCIVDGMPLLWISRWLRLNLYAKVSGANLIEDVLLDQKTKEYKVYFFGGAKGVARKASLRINRMKSKVRAVGYCYPGFGSSEEMSSRKIRDAINKTQPNILLVSLGAKKGALWIEKNRKELQANVISHVGAVINFIAGNVKRAPLWIQKCGIEWIWRIYQEWYLVQRYWNDGLILVCLFITKIVPYRCLINRFEQKNHLFSPSDIHFFERPSFLECIIAGSCRWSNLDKIRLVFKEMVLKKKDIVINFSKTDYVDAAFLGILLILLKWQVINQRNLKLVNLNKTLQNIFRFNSLENVFT